MLQVLVGRSALFCQSEDTWLVLWGTWDIGRETGEVNLCDNSVTVLGEAARSDHWAHI